MYWDVEDVAQLHPANEVSGPQTLHQYSCFRTIGYDAKRRFVFRPAYVIGTSTFYILHGFHCFVVLYHLACPSLFLFRGLALLCIQCT